MFQALALDGDVQKERGIVNPGQAMQSEEWKVRGFFYSLSSGFQKTGLGRPTGLGNSQIQGRTKVGGGSPKQKSSPGPSQPFLNSRGRTP